ncbi:tyrosine protein phosphatase [Paenibacillus sp. MWE-103]|uniref:Tyrosine-protein phosphatase n=1 Tax=Paenibacillus artemisiicola TaxID=1172618 RepID=A0ABS3WI59_9BACL|nr:CpsB/CapC family capsule biosynthesis tyrosine phosphatase [Paenibacillus artemisiicola]MBO7747820.1 tyrosine protein phosphatase [Paenibacillus artemisiicola]
MVEIHSHILPSIDDGARSKNEAVEMAVQAVNQGIHAIIATPHHGNGVFETPPSVVNQSVGALNELFQRQGLPVAVYSGQEIRVHDGLLDEWEHNGLLTLAGSRYILLELPSNHVPGYFMDMLYEFAIRGIIPVIAHPERNKVVSANPDLVRDWIEKGALCQLTSQSLTGYFGRKVQKLSFQLYNRRMIHFVSSDAHSSLDRTFSLQEAYTLIGRRMGKREVERLRNNAERLLRNEEILAETPKKKRRLLFR